MNIVDSLPSALFRHLFSPAVLGVCWTNYRVWSPVATVLGLLSLVAPKRIETFASLCDEAGQRLGLPTEKPDPAGFHRALGKLIEHPDALESLQLELGRLIEMVSRRQRLPTQSWHGRMLVAIDASDVVLGTSQPLIAHYGGPETAAGQVEVAHGKLIVAWDVQRKAVLGWHLAPYRSSERELLAEVLAPLAAGTVVLLDRGYPAREVFELLHERDLRFIVRMPGGKAAWKSYRNLVQRGSGIREAPINLTAHAGGAIRQARVIVKPWRRGRPRTGSKPQPTILLTDLCDPAITAGSICAAYERRWAIETFFRELKVTVTNVERWHSRSPERLVQELHAVLIWFLLAALIELIRHQHALQRGFPHDTRVVERVRLLRRTVALLFELMRSGQCQFLAELELLGKHLVSPKPGRHFPRRRKSPLGRTKG